MTGSLAMLLCVFCVRRAGMGFLLIRHKSDVDSQTGGGRDVLSSNQIYRKDRDGPHHEYAHDEIKSHS